MHGKPLISSEIGTGTSFVNRHNETGFVVQADDAQSLKNAMNELWNNDELCERLGRNARKNYEDIFTAEQMAKSYLTLYQEVIAKQVY